ncbi:MAG: ATP-binding cassette domain-containing protein [Liquorilactobacillus ghanensis]|uniref:methionine ABC transporter ATP-binding protein n=1 Tax=Liquorilactobacillus ghanensis TaxID=399370 RepID=UPI0039EC564A
MTVTDNVIELKDISVDFPTQDKAVKAVKQVNLTIKKGDIYGIIGYSGAGKSTLVRVINLLQQPTTGQVIFNGQQLQKLAPVELRQARKKIGMIFQHFNLMKSRTVLGNVEYPLLGGKISKSDRRAKALNLLELVGLKNLANSYPNNLSGGQKQRVAIARALANDPEVLISDEATSALDPKTTKSILKLLQQVNQRLGITIVLITHEMQVISRICHNVAVMDNGEIIERGAVAEVFTKPKQQLTADFVETAINVKDALERIGNQEKYSNGNLLVYLNFIGQTSKKSIISKISREYNLDVNILFANVDQVDGKDIGYMIAEFVGEPKTANKAIAEMKKDGIIAKMINSNKE